MKYLNRREQAAYLEAEHNIIRSAKTLSKKATTGGGPKYVVFGGEALSTPEWLDEWVAEGTSKPRYSTSEVA